MDRQKEWIDKWLDHTAHGIQFTLWYRVEELMELSSSHGLQPSHLSMGGDTVFIIARWTTAQQ